MKKTFLWSRILLIFSMALQLMTQWQNFQFNAFSVISSNTSLSILLALCTLSAYLLLDLGCYFLWYFRSKRAVAEGKPCVSPMTGLRKAALWVPLLLTIVMCVVMITDAPGQNARLFYLLILAATFGIIALMTFLQKRFKKLGWPAKKTRNATMVIAVLLALLLCGGMVWFITAFDLSPSLDEQMNDILHLPKPKLTIDDLAGPADPVPWAQHKIERSVLATYTVYSEHRDDSSLEYRLVEIGWDRLRELVFEVMADRNHFTETERAGLDDRWQAEIAYVRPTRTEICEFIALYDNAILYVQTDIPLDDRLIVTIESALLP